MNPVYQFQAENTPTAWLASFRLFNIAFLWAEEALWPCYQCLAVKILELGSIIQLWANKPCVSVSAWESSHGLAG